MHILISILHWSASILAVYVIGIIALVIAAAMTENSKLVSDIFKFGPYWLPIVVATPVVLLFAGIVEGIAVIGRSNFMGMVREDFDDWRRHRRYLKEQKLRNRQFERDRRLRLRRENQAAHRNGAR